MLRLYAEEFVGLSGWLSQMQLSYLNPAPVGNSGPAPSPLADESLQVLRQKVTRAKELAESMEFKRVARVADRLLIAIGDPTDQKRHMVANYADDIAHLLGEMANCLKEELESRRYFQLSDEGATRYGQASIILQGPAWEKLPATRNDLAEAIDCLALERATASVFHLMRAMEVVVRKLSRRLKVPITPQTTWGRMTHDMDSKIRAMPNMTNAQKRKKNDWEEARVNLAHIGSVWRNNTMHPAKSYTVEQAADVLDAVRVFMASLARL
jgi:hypothetical protein